MKYFLNFMGIAFDYILASCDSDKLRFQWLVFDLYKVHQ